jgi:hypothetical protein
MGTLNIYNTDVVFGSRPTTYYGGPSLALRSIILQTVYSGFILEANSPCGANCSYPLVFLAPAYKCEDVDLFEPNAPWCLPRNGIPNGNCSSPYFGGDVVVDVPYFGGNSTTSANETDGLLWVKYYHYDSDVLGVNQSAEQVPLPPAPQNISFKCQLWQSRYEVQRSFVNSKQYWDFNTT